MKTCLFIKFLIFTNMLLWNISLYAQESIGSQKALTTEMEAIEAAFATPLQAIRSDLNAKNSVNSRLQYTPINY